MKQFIFHHSPFYCLKCGDAQSTSGICSQCSIVSSPTYYDSFRYLQTYEGSALQLVKLHKQYYHHEVLHLYAELLVSVLDKSIPVIFVPDSSIGQFKKGRCSFCHTLELLLRKKGFKVICKILKKSSSGKMQKLLSHRKRLENAQKSFKLHSEATKFETQADKSIQLVDDIFTTGATINQCAKLLKEYGYQKVYAYSLFRTKFSKITH